jgi:hypothetical protein
VGVFGLHDPRFGLHGFQLFYAVPEGAYQHHMIYYYQTQ